MSPLQKPGEKPARPGESHRTAAHEGAAFRTRSKSPVEAGDTPLPPTQEPNRTWRRIGPPKK